MNLFVEYIVKAIATNNNNQPVMRSFSYETFNQR